MSEKTKKLIVIGVAVVLIGTYVIWYVSTRGPSALADSTGFYYICNNRSCGNTWHVTAEEMHDWQVKHYGSPYTCPKCGGTDLIKGVKCPNCGKVFPAARRGPDKCPSCGTEFQPKRGDGT